MFFIDLEIVKKARDIANQIQESDIQSYILKQQKKLDTQFLRLVADQWIARQKARYKLPTWFANTGVIYPMPLSVEQSSSEITAHYKASLFAQPDYPILTDLTGGMGVDTTAFAKLHRQVIYIEQNPALIPVAQHNFDVLGYSNIEVRNDNSAHYLKSNRPTQHTHYFIDPARRDSARNKVFRIQDCEPDLLDIKHLLGRYLVKYSPILDIKSALEQLKNISEVHVVAVENEVKELLFLSDERQTETRIVCVNFLANHTQQTFEFNTWQEQQLSVSYALPKRYVYEPNAAILKAGAFKAIAHTYGVEKLAPNSHLYTSDTHLGNFPGRSFICEAVCKFDKKEILTRLTGNQANITTRNFPLKPDEIRKKLGLKDGGDTYIFATENYHQQKMVLICRKAPLLSL